MLLERVHAAWRQGYPVASLLTLDVKGAFDNALHPRLLHNLRKRGIPESVICWLKSFLADRETVLTLLEGPMLEVQLRTGIPQGSPLSPILYLFYNADLIDEIANRYGNIALVTGYIDDVCILVWGLSPEVNYWQLERIHHIAERWEKTHASRFSPKKYRLIHMYKT